MIPTKCRRRIAAKSFIPESSEIFSNEARPGFV